MKRINSLLIEVSVFFVFLNSCVYDVTSQIGIVKNLSNKHIVVVFGNPDSIEITDKSLIYGPKYNIRAGFSDTINELGYYDKVSLFFFDYDTLNYYLTKRDTNDVAKKSFLKKIVFATDSIKKENIIIYNDK